LGLELVAEPTAGLRLETIQEDRSSQDVFCKPLHSSSVPRGYRNISMQAHTPFPNTTIGTSGFGFLSALVELHRVDSIAESMPRETRFRTGRYAGANGSGHQSRKQRIVAGQGVFVAVESALFKNSHHASRRSSHDPSHVFGCGRGQREEGAGGMGWAAVNAIEYDAVKMWCQIRS